MYAYKFKPTIILYKVQYKSTKLGRHFANFIKEMYVIENFWMTLKGLTLNSSLTQSVSECSHWPAVMGNTRNINF